MSLPPRFCVLLTATIRPAVSKDMELVRSDPEVRRRDYEEALRFWLRLPVDWIQGIVFAENSGADLSSLEKIATSVNDRGIPVEFISCVFPPPPAGLHYGFSEISLVCHALKESRLLREADTFIKATGRYRFPEVDRLVRSLPAGFNVAVDSKLSRFWSRNRHYLTHFALALFRRSFFEAQLIDLPSRMVPAPPWTRAQFIETVLYDRLLELKSQPGLVLRWPVNCEPVGVGANGDDYGTARKRLQQWVRGLGRRVAPGVWI
ncbi:MAG TPA: hypothetical protein VHD32_05960 [Candidatus Didemnitutus sp.]|nr:hypothetical protein [Candidatus Didemnitutus sp.]